MLSHEKKKFGDIFKYDTAIQDDDATKLYLMCTTTDDGGGDDEYFEMIRFNETTLTLSFYRDHVQIRNKTPGIIKRLRTLDS